MGRLGKTGWLRSGLAAVVAAATLAASASGAAAQWLDDAPGAQQGTLSYGYYKWMHKDVKKAWSKGYEGQKTRVIVVDDFINLMSATNPARLDDSWVYSSHGYFTRRQVDMIAPRADVRRHEWTKFEKKVGLHKSRLNVINLSYWWSPGGSGWDTMNASIIKAANKGKAVVVKSAGNSATRMGDQFYCGTCSTPGLYYDVLANDMASGKSVIFVGALEKNGHKKSKARISDYSSTAGKKSKFQKRFLVVGVDEAKHGLAGTSFAAPVVAGYAAILGSKFKGAEPKQISKQLLNTARTNTIKSYKTSVHGQGEACLACALAPKKIK